MVNSPGHADEATRVAHLKAFGDFIANIDAAPVLKYRSLKDVVMTPGDRPVFTSKAAKMITTVNAMMQAWVDNDKSAYKALTTSDGKKQK